ncbi:SRPBCC domain-containing protein [Microbacterium sp. Marseille-Q6965]|uniref:SRPBCC domain-containing protein n=1 Tax=Microbacterium sp. Marseille-Q6965 TaxID=2965072 RepID=UPI0021B84661|nr:SRPBCC domain-containing protein [Microbacterium sp. Marseille-Q6965]
MDGERMYRIETGATPQRTWAALTDPVRVRSWYYGTWPRTTWQVGSPLEYVDEDGEVQLSGTVLSYDPPRSFSHSFIATWGGGREDQGILTWTIEPEDGGSRVTLIHTGGHGAETAEGSKELVEALREHLRQPDA